MLADLDLDRRAFEQACNVTVTWAAGAEADVPAWLDYPDLMALGRDVVVNQPQLSWFDDRLSGIAQAASIVVTNRGADTTYTLAEPPQRIGDGAVLTALLRSA